MNGIESIHKKIDASIYFNKVRNKLDELKSNRRAINILFESETEINQMTRYYNQLIEIDNDINSLKKVKYVSTNSDGKMNVYSIPKDIRRILKLQLY